MEQQTFLQKQFSQAISEHYGIIYHHLWQYIPPEHHDDVQQIILEAAWKSFQTFRYECRFSSWLWSICVYKCIDWLRRERVSKAQQQRYLKEMDIMEGHHIPYSIIQKIREAFAALPPLDQKFLTLYYIENKKGYQVAEALKLSQTNVVQKARRLKQKMKDHILPFN